MPRPRSKRDLASDHLEHALSECAQALSKLGGRVRHGSKKLPPEPTFTARQYLEGIIARLGVVKALVDNRRVFFSKETPELIEVDASAVQKDTRDSLLRIFPEIALANVRTPRDDFERDYDSTRNPQC